MSGTTLGGGAAPGTDAAAGERPEVVPTVRRTPRRRPTLGGTSLSAVAVVLGVLWLVPLAWAVDTAFKPEAETTSIPVTWIPSEFTLDAFVSVFAQGDLLRWLFNSVVVAVAVTVLTLVLCSAAAYGFSRMDFPFKKAVLALVLAGIMVPPQVLIVPLFEQMRALHLVDTYPGIVLPQVVAPAMVFILKKFFDGIPKEYEEAAEMDGAGPLRTFWNVVLPMSKPILTAVAIFTFIHAWNNFLWPFIVTTEPDMMTVPVGLAAVQGSYGLRYAQIMAAAVAAGLPLVLIYALFQRQVVRGVGDAGLKG